MPLGVQRDNGLVHDGLGTAGAASRELVGVARRAVWATALFHEATTAQLLLATAADEVLSMP